MIYYRKDCHSHFYTKNKEAFFFKFALITISLYLTIISKMPLYPCQLFSIPISFSVHIHYLSLSGLFLFAFHILKMWWHCVAASQVHDVSFLFQLYSISWFFVLLQLLRCHGWRWDDPMLGVVLECLRRPHSL